ncbi:acyltransferase-domain-containing protein, partial [Neoconidiobolus thromboides FSU 785]
FYIKTGLVIIMFIFSAIVINSLQIICLPLALFDRKKFDNIIHFTQQLFGISMVAFHQLFAPTSFILYKDNYKTKLNLPERLLLICNHQLYSDWIYIWCFSYFARRHGDLKIILKKSLAKIPVFGWGMWFFDFIFLERNWTKDEFSFMAHMKKLNQSIKPMWLLIFPEGTTLTGDTRYKSKIFAEKNGYETYKHVLLPRSLGLFKCIESLKESVEYIYDITIGIPGVKAGESPQYIYTLALMYVIGLNPQQIHIHIRRFKLNEIPIDEDEFGNWLRLRWKEKDEYLDHFYKHGCF